MNEFDINRIINGHVLPPLPPFPKGAKQFIDAADVYGDAHAIEGIAPDTVERTIFGTPMVMPLKMKLQSENKFWLLPTEPLITVNSKNILVKRNVAKSKMRGSIKERWAQDDYSISIQELFTVPDTFNYPRTDVERLRSYCEAKEPIDVLCPLFDALKINRIVIEDYDFPHTKGEENQNWMIKALSDDDWELLLNIDD